MHRQYVALVNTRHADGTPRLITVMKDETVIVLAGDEEFVTLYLPEIDWSKRPRPEPPAERSDS